MNMMVASLDSLQKNAIVLQTELQWFEHFLQKRAECFRIANENKAQVLDLQIKFLSENPPPSILPDDDSFYAQLIREMSNEAQKHYVGELFHFQHIAERVILLLALAPHIKPQLLDIFFYPNLQNREFTEFGGIKGVNHKGFLPTGETAMYLLAGDHLSLRFQFQVIFNADHYFYKKNILRLHEPAPFEPLMSGAVQISKEYLHLLTTGEHYQPQFSMDFPAHLLTTQLVWEDLVLDYYTQRDIEEVRAWIRYRHEIAQNPAFSKEIKGYRCLFYGESGTGKTLTTNLLGKEIGMDVYRIDLSKIISKYIGETEKNLSHIFEQAANKDWILFFDEGDALFGKRTQAKSSNDRYANQEISYLLQKIEEHSGVIILATNLRSNMDKAFIRRFQSEVYFPMPDERSRLTLWKKSFNGYRLEKEIDLEDTAKRYEITGAAIKNVKHYCGVMALERSSDLILWEDFKEGLRKQLDKEGKKL